MPFPDRGVPSSPKQAVESARRSRRRIVKAASTYTRHRAISLPRNPCCLAIANARKAFLVDSFVGQLRVTLSNAEGLSSRYPAHSIEHASLEDGMRITIRPIRPDDDKMVRAFLHGLSRESTSNRLLSGRNLTPAEIDHLTQIDYEKEMAFIAVTSADGHESEIGVARYVRDDDRTSAEFALLIADAWQRRGVGTLLMSTLLKHARSAGIVRIHGTAYSTNKAMIDLARKLGFAVISVPSDATILELAISLARDDCAPLKG